MTQWQYDEDFDPKDYVGFVYLITNIVDGRIYVGKKNFHTAVYKPLNKSELAARTDGRSSKKKLVTKESNWQNYWSSSKELQSDVKEIGEEYFTKKILHLAKTRRGLTYLEVKYQFKYQVLEVDSYNISINGTFFKGNIE